MLFVKKVVKEEMESINSVFNEVIDYILDLYFSEKWERKVVIQVKKIKLMNIVFFYEYFIKLFEFKKRNYFLKFVVLGFFKINLFYQYQLVLEDMIVS